MSKLCPSPIALGPNLQVFPVALAPMAGITDLPMRREAVRQGAPYAVCEMLAGEHLAEGRPDMAARALGASEAGPFIVQLAGRAPHWIAAGARIAAEAGAQAIDINMGCPAKVVTNGACGAALMREPDLACRLVEAAIAASGLPVTAKMRLGWERPGKSAAALARKLEAAGARLLTVHGRFRSDFYRGRADWGAIGEVVQAAAIPVIANGDITDLCSARQALSQSGAAGIMIGRGAQGRPWIVGAIARALETGQWRIPSKAERVEGLLRIYEDSLSQHGRNHGARVARKHIAWTLDDLAGEAGMDQARRAWRQDICRLEAPEAVIDDIRRFCADLPETGQSEAIAA